MKVTTKVITLMLIAFSFTISASAQKRAQKKADIQTAEWRYEIECAGTGTQGSYLVKVWSYSKKPHVALDQAKKNAVHGVIFKGFPGGAQGCTSQKPLARSANLEQEKADYFTEFFADGGKYMKFVTQSTDGQLGSGDVTKVGKKEWKVGVVVSVQKDMLRQELEAANIIRGLSSGF